MAITNKHRNAVYKMRRWAKAAQDLHADAFDIKELFDEEMATVQDWSLDPADGQVTAQELLDLGVVYSDLAALVNQPISNYINFFTGGTVSTREFGKEIRAIANIE